MILTHVYYSLSLTNPFEKEGSQENSLLTFGDIKDKKKGFESNIKTISKLNSINNLAYIERGPIVIDGNANFSATASLNGWSGNGAILNPYIIENFNITGTGSENLIDIRNTDVSFIINQSLLINGYIGLNLYNVTNGVISNLYSLNNSFYGILIDSSSNNTFFHNNATNNGASGFLLYSSYDNIVINNTALNNDNRGFFLWFSENNSLKYNFANNNAQHGFYLAFSNSSTLKYNYALDNGLFGFSLDTSNNNSLLENNSTRNNIGFLLSTASDNVLNSNKASININSGYYLQSISDNNTLNQNTANNNTQHGFNLDSSNYNTFSDNNSMNNTQNGFRLFSSSNNTFNDNLIDHNNNGTLIQSSNNNSFFTNNITNNKDSGFLLGGSSNNTFDNNIVDHNSRFGFWLSNSKENFFISNLIINNNNYGMIISDTSSNNSIERNDFVYNNPLGISQVEDDGFNNVFSHNYWHFLNSTYQLDGNANNFDTSPVNIPYILNIFPSIEPRFSSVPTDMNFIEGSTPQYPLIWLPIDDNPLNYTIFQNQILFRAGTWTNGSQIKIDIIDLSQTAGNWNYTIVILDEDNQTTSHTVFVFVSPFSSTTSPSSTTSSKSTSSDFSFPDFINDTAFLSIIIGGLLILGFVSTFRIGRIFLSRKRLVQQMNAPNYKTAIKVQEGGFPNYEIYQIANSEGFNSYKTWKIKEERKTKLLSLMERVDRMPQEQFKKYLNFTDDNRFLDWIVSLPKDSPLRLDGEFIVFKQRDLADSEVLNSIDELISSYERNSKNKI
ncbi:MAG: NosD domain-containing protein [Candidatus Hodarchaeales archaeon]